MTREQAERYAEEATRCGWTRSPRDVSRSMFTSLLAWAFVGEVVTALFFTTRLGYLPAVCIIIPIAFILQPIQVAINLRDYHRAMKLPKARHPAILSIIAFALAPILGIPALFLKTGWPSRHSQNHSQSPE